MSVGVEDLVEKSKILLEELKKTCASNLNNINNTRILINNIGEYLWVEGEFFACTAKSESTLTKNVKLCLQNDQLIIPRLRKLVSDFETSLGKANWENKTPSELGIPEIINCFDDLKERLKSITRISTEA